MAAPINGWIAALAKSINAPLTPEHIKFLQAWQRAEGGSTANNANYNPLNTTMGSRFPGINSVGVRSYPNLQIGVQETANTLLNGRYGNLVQMLRNPNSNAAQLGQAVAQSPWGTGQGVLRALGASTGPQSNAVLAPAGSGRVSSNSGRAPNTNALGLFLLNRLNSFASGGKTNPLDQLLGANLVNASWGNGGRAPAPDFGKPKPPNPGGLAKFAPQGQLIDVGGVQLDRAVAPEAAALAKRFGLRINSGYRSQEHNAAVGGAQNSDHLSGLAADFVGSPQAMKALYQYAQGKFPYVEPWSQAHGNHVHISFARRGSYVA